MNHPYINRLSHQKATGSGRLTLPLAETRKFPIPVAPISEQEGIVAEIEKQFSRLDGAVANLKCVKANLKRYKAAVLKAAVEGKLTDATVDGGLFDEGQWRSVGSLLLSIDQGWSPRCEKSPVAAAGDWGVIKTTAVQEFRFDQIENKKLPSALEPRPNLEIKVGDLLITRAGPRKRVGVTCLVRSTQPGLMICDKVYRLRCDASKIRPAYLELVLNAPQVLEKLNELKTGISDSGVNLTQKRFRGLSIPIPSLSTQALLEAEVERIVSTCEAIDGTCQAELLRADRLRQSILTKAFSGA
jgi:type I restriction enzyme S subunit